MRSRMNLRKQRKVSEGITLIALTITIILLLILAGTTIGILTGDNGILNKADKASEENNKQTATEIMNLKITNAQIQSYSENQELPTLQYLANRLCEDEEMQYVALETKKTAKLDEITVGDSKYIYTKLKEYPYEFQIDGKLRLASIDGIKVSDTNEENFVSKEEYNILLERIGELEKKLDSTTNRQNPTGIKTEAYIRNERNVTTAYNKVTSMNGFTRTTDANNKIAEYISYDNTSGYTVLKSGWYFINLKAVAYGNPSNGPSMYLDFIIDEKIVANAGHDGLQGVHGSDANSFSIFLEQGQTFYFSASGINEAYTRIVEAMCYPMF